MSVDAFTNTCTALLLVRLILVDCCLRLILVDTFTNSCYKFSDLQNLLIIQYFSLTGHTLSSLFPHFFLTLITVSWHLKAIGTFNQTIYFATHVLKFNVL